MTYIKNKKKKTLGVKAKFISLKVFRMHSLMNLTATHLIYIDRRNK